MSKKNKKQGRYMGEYESLRSEIISLQEISRSVWLHMYVIFISIFILGMEWSYYLLLLEYIILIPFQTVINGYKYSITKLSAYMKVFYEEEELYWEGFHKYKEYSEYYNKVNNNFFNKIRNTGGVQLGFLTTIYFAIKLLYNKYLDGNFYLTYVDIGLLFCSVVLYFILVIVNKEYKRDYNDDLMKIMNRYKEYRRK